MIENQIFWRVIYYAYIKRVVYRLLSVGQKRPAQLLTALIDFDKAFDESRGVRMLRCIIDFRLFALPHISAVKMHFYLEHQGVFSIQVIFLYYLLLFIVMLPT